MVWIKVSKEVCTYHNHFIIGRISSLLSLFITDMLITSTFVIHQSQGVRREKEYIAECAVTGRGPNKRKQRNVSCDDVEIGSSPTSRLDQIRSTRNYEVSSAGVISTRHHGTVTTSLQKGSTSTPVVRTTRQCASSISRSHNAVLHTVHRRGSATNITGNGHSRCWYPINTLSRSARTPCRV